MILNTSRLSREDVQEMVRVTVERARTDALTASRDLNKTDYAYAFGHLVGWAKQEITRLELALNRLKEDESE